MREKTIIELQKEKELAIVKFDEQIRLANVRRMKKNEEANKIRRAKIREYEEDGWNSSCISPNQPEPEPKPKPKKKSKHKHVHKKVEKPKEPVVDSKDIELAKLKEQIATLEAAKELEKGEEAEVVKEIVEEVVEEVIVEEGEAL